MNTARLMKHLGTVLAWALLSLSPLRAQVTVEIEWANITATPTTAAGYGIANGSNLDAWAAKTLPSGTVLGTTDTQTLTNKDLTAANNTYRDASATETGAVKWRGVLNVLDYGAPTDGTSDSWAAIDNAMTDAASLGFAVRFPLGTTNNTYTIGDGEATPDLAGVPLIFDDGVILSVASGAFVSYKDWQLITPVTLIDRGKPSVSTTLWPTRQTERPFLSLANPTTASLVTKPTAVDFTTWEARAYASLGTSTASATSIVPTVAATSVSYAAASITTNEGIFNNAPQIGQLYAVSIAGTSTSTTAYITAWIDCGSEVYRFALPSNAGSNPIIAHVYKAAGGTFTQVGSDITLPARSYGWQSAATSVLAVRIVTGNTFEVYVNGYYVVTITSTTGYPIERLGFGANAVATQTGSTVTIRNGYYGTLKAPNKAHRLKLCMIGDSITFGSGNSTPWPGLLQLALEGRGYANVEIDATTYPHSGDTAATQLSAITGQDFSDFDYVLVLVGTNDIQSATSLSTFRTNIEGIATQIVSGGSTPIFGIPPLFTSNSGVGFATSNYAKGGEYRACIANVAANGGYYLADAMTALGQVDSNTVALWDNLHPNELGSILIARAFAQAVTAATALPVFDDIGSTGAAMIGGHRQEWRTALPTEGYYRAGDIIWHTDDAGTAEGSAADVVVLGWYRLTSSNAHTLGTDWYPLEIRNRTQGSSISDPSGGSTIDAEARTAINTLIDRLEAAGLIAAP